MPYFRTRLFANGGHLGHDRLIAGHPYYYRRRMQISLQDLKKNLPVRNSTPIIVNMCLRLDIASPLPLDGSLFALFLCFFTEIRV